MYNPKMTAFLRVALSAALMVPLLGWNGLAQQSSAAVESEVHQGKLAFQKNDFKSAEEHFAKALKADPGLVEVRSLLARACYYDHKYSQAIQQYRKVVQSKPSIQGVEPYRSLSMAAIGECTQAIPGLKSEFDSKLAPDLRRVVGLSLQGCLQNKGDVVEADTVTRQLLELFPKDPDVLYQAGQMYGKLSSSLYLRLVKVAPHSARGYQVLGDAAASDGRWKDAIAAYRKATQADPSIPDIHFHLAVLLAQYSSEPDAWKEALDELNKEIAIAPRNPTAEYEIAMIWHKHNQADKAVAALRRALDVAPSFVEGRLALAKMLSEQNQKREALQVLEPALKTAPNNPSVRYMLARLYMQLGQTAAAKREEAAFQRLRQKSNGGH